MSFDSTGGLRVPTGPVAGDVWSESGSDARLWASFNTLVVLQREQLAAAMARLVGRVLALDGPITVVSVLRAGLPVGLALVGACRAAGREVGHREIPFVRGDDSGLALRAGDGTVVLTDGWTGSGATLVEIRRRSGRANTLLAALADPAGVCDLAGTRSDMLCPHALLLRALVPAERGRPRGGGGAEAGPSGALSPALQEYVRILCADVLTSVVLSGDQLEPQRPRAPISVKRDRFRFGVNECWRAYARGELGGLVIDSGARSSPGVDLLARLSRVPLRVAPLRYHSCVGAVRR